MTDRADSAGIDAVSFYVGQVMHARLRPRTHRFKYRSFMILLDLDRLDLAATRSPLFRINARGAMSFQEGDHLPAEPGASLAERARNVFASHGIRVDQCRIQILCLPRILGYAFNPISIFYATDEDNRLRGVIYEVRNTFGERHAYAAPGSGGNDGPSRHMVAKRFHVSPFLPMDLTYRFSASPPGERLQLRIMEGDAEGPILSAGFSGKHLEFANLSIFRLFFSLPMMTVKVIVGIHYEALRLYFKGLPVHPHPAR
jgi:uncharacterized protein